MSVFGVGLWDGAQKGHPVQTIKFAGVGGCMVPFAPLHGVSSGPPHVVGWQGTYFDDKLCQQRQQHRMMT